MPSECNEISSILRINARGIECIQRHDYDNARQLLRHAIRLLKGMSKRTRNDSKKIDQMHIAYADTYNNIACIHRSEKKYKRAKLSISQALSFSKRIVSKKHRIFNVVTTLINLSVVDLQLRNVLLSIGHSSRACVLLLETMQPKHKISNENTKQQYTFEIMSNADEQTSCDLLISALYNMANELEVLKDISTASKLYNIIEYLTKNWLILSGENQLLSKKVKTAIKEIKSTNGDNKILLEAEYHDTDLVLEKLRLIATENARLYSVYSNDICLYDEKGSIGVDNGAKNVLQNKVECKLESNLAMKKICKNKGTNDKKNKKTKKINRPKSAITYYNSYKHENKMANMSIDSNNLFSFKSPRAVTNSSNGMISKPKRPKSKTRIIKHETTTALHRAANTRKTRIKISSALQASYFLHPLLALISLHLARKALEYLDNIK